MLFEGDLVNQFLAPLEGSGLGVVDLDEVIDGLADLTRVGEAVPAVPTDIPLIESGVHM